MTPQSPHSCTSQLISQIIEILTVLRCNQSVFSNTLVSSSAFRIMIVVKVET